MDRSTGNYKSNGNGAHEAGEVPPITIRKASDLQYMVFPPLKWVVPGYLPEGLTLLAGAPKIGKSWLSLDIGLAVAAGRYVLGDILCPQGDVLALCLEDNERRLQRRLQKLLGGSSAKWPEHLHLATKWPRSNEHGLDLIEAWVEEVEKPTLVIVDVLMMFRPVSGGRDLNLYEADYGALKGLQELAGEHRIAALVPTHTRKSGAESGDVLETISGTLGLSGAADASLVLARTESGVTLTGRGRDLEEIDVALAFDKENCRWRIEGEAAEVQRKDSRTMTLDVLKGAFEPMTPTEIADVTGLPRAAVKQLLFRMAQFGDVLKLKKGLYVHPDRTDLTA